MSCTNWNERLTERLYDEIEPADDAALTAHLDGCEDCRSNLAALSRVRTVLSEHAPEIPRLPRVVVLPKRARLRPALMAASILGAAILAGAGAGFGYALGRGQAAASPAVATMDATATEAAVKQEVDRRLAAWEAAQAKSGPSGATATANSSTDQPVSATALRAELAKLERKVDGARATDLDYVLEQIAASEYRVAHRIGKTNDALRNVALASNAYPSEQ